MFDAKVFCDVLENENNCILDTIVSDIYVDPKLDLKTGLTLSNATWKLIKYKHPLITTRVVPESDLVENKRIKAVADIYNKHQSGEPINYVRLADEIVQYCDAHPLAEEDKD